MARKQIELTDNHGMLHQGNRLFKAHHWKGTRVVYEEIDIVEYDRRVADLAEKLAAMPGVDLLAVLKDALYDLSLKRLEKVEAAFSKEVEASEEPRIVTTSRDRGTCINVAIGGRFAFQVRE